MSDALLDPVTPETAEPTVDAARPIRVGEMPMDGPCDEPATDIESVGGLFSPERRALTAGLVMAVTLVAFEALAVSTVMPIVARDLGDLTLYGWVFSAFFLASIVGIIVAGGLVDRGGLVRPMIAALGLFSIGLIVGGLAPSMPILVGGRILQGLGAGAIPPIGYVTIGRAFPDELRPRMFAVLSTAWVLPGLVGPALAGAVAEATTWRLVFLGLLPLILVAAAITLPALSRVAGPDEAGSPGSAAVAVPADLTAPAAGADPWRRLRLALVVVAGAALVVGGLTSASLVPGLPFVVVGVALILPAYRRLTPPGTLRALPVLPAAVLLRGILTFTFFAADAYVPLALQGWRGLGPAVAGLALTGATLSWTAGAWVQARKVADWGVVRLVRTGFVTVVVGVVGFALILAPSVPVAVGLLAWSVAGLGMG
ncbi:MAG TPA: MFS transporter, partial [Patescibacteria group bacterium]|nr:MFS transporter [Patescibacteria group bacterium]